MYKEQARVALYKRTIRARRRNQYVDSRNWVLSERRELEAHGSQCKDIRGKEEKKKKGIKKKTYKPKITIRYKWYGIQVHNIFIVNI